MNKCTDFCNRFTSEEIVHPVLQFNLDLLRQSLNVSSQLIQTQIVQKFIYNTKSLLSENAISQSDRLPPDICMV